MPIARVLIQVQHQNYPIRLAAMYGVIHNFILVAAQTDTLPALIVCVLVWAYGEHLASAIKKVFNRDRCGLKMSVSKGEGGAKMPTEGRAPPLLS